MTDTVKGLQTKANILMAKLKVPCSPKEPSPHLNVVVPSLTHHRDPPAHFMRPCELLEDKTSLDPCRSYPLQLVIRLTKDGLLINMFCR